MSRRFASPSCRSKNQPAKRRTPPSTTTARRHYITGDWYSLGVFGKLKLTIGYYIDTLTVVMFCMVTLIASCVHIYAFGYMHDELHDYTDHEVTLADGKHLHRRGRFHRFFQYLSLFSFSMLGICIAGNLAMTFVFWELVGICSYFLIGFYIERHSASTAANKAFIVNRVGDFGMLIGLMAIWTTLGTFNFGDMHDADGTTATRHFQPAAHAREQLQAGPDRRHDRLRGPRPNRGSRAAAGATDPAAIEAAVAAEVARLRADRTAKWGHWLLVHRRRGHLLRLRRQKRAVPAARVAPRRDGRPDARLRARPFGHDGRRRRVPGRPRLSDFLAGSAARDRRDRLHHAVPRGDDRRHAVDIKRVLAYSTVSQLGFMMLALGLGGWVAGLFHLITHAFFKSLLFLCSRLGDSRRPHERHAADGRPAQEDADHRLHDAHRLPGDRRRRHAVPGRLQRLPFEGRDRRAGPQPLAPQLERRILVAACSSCPCSARR